MRAGNVGQGSGPTRQVSAERAVAALSAAGMGAWDWNLVTGELAWDDAIAVLHGMDPGEFDGRMESFLSRVHPEDRTILEAQIQHALDTGAFFATEFRVLRPDGRTAWIQGRGQVYTAPDGTPIRMIGVGLDTTALRSSRERAARSLEHIGDGLAVLDTDWRIVYLNDEAARLAARVRTELLDRHFFDVVTEARRSIVQRQFEQAMQSQQPRTFEVFHDGTEAWLEFRCYPAPDGLTIVFHDITERRSAQRERERLLAAERAAKGRLRLLADASQRLAGSLEQREVVETLTRLVVPTLADWVVVELREGQVLRRAAVVHRDAAQAAVAAELAAAAPIALSSDTPPARVHRTGLALLAETVDEAFLEDLAGSPRSREIIAALGAHSVMVLPLVSHGHTVGVMSLFSDDPAHEFGPEDLSLAEQLASRAALALDNAALYRREHQVADALQRAVLPAQLPAIAGYELAARYVPAISDVKVAGDWYDAFPTGRDTVALAVGDVAGHGLAAASLMGQLRNALRAYAVQGGPAAVLTELSDLLAAVDPEAMATVVHGELEPVSGILYWASAGHPPPVFIPEPGVAVLLDQEPAAPVCALTSSLGEPVKAHELWLEPGNVLCWYTDGLVERRGEGLTERLEQLRVTAADLGPDRSAEDICDRLLAGLLDVVDNPDDLCLLVLRRLG